MKIAITWSILGFISGSIPFSYLLAKLISGKDVRDYGDGNPGAVNAFKAAGWRIGLLALLSDYLKAALPVGIAHFILGINGWEIVPVAIAPVLGHAFSPFLKGRGGKAVAATFGMWTGLTLAEGPVVLGLFYIALVFSLDSDAWSTVLGAVGVLSYMAVTGHSGPVLTAGFLVLLIIVFRQGRLLLVRPRLRMGRAAAEIRDA
jgi:acyl phosphate:glycerol-3-phosphate acyltransferase